ncbi:MAG: hypothetical protein KA712_14995, partial [Myxococcales bacterium]|nr:hypothetical protein [Myxococcales bacterium]
MTVTKEEQAQLVAQLAKKVCRLNARYDREGNVVSLNLSNHQKFCGEGQDGNRPVVTWVPVGFKDTDVDDLLKFPELRRVRFEKMLMTDAGYAVVAK